MAPLAQQLVLLQVCSLGLFLLPAGAQLTTTQELYVKPTEDTSCPEPCHTLDEYVQNASQYFVSNTTVNFLPGNHNLSQSFAVNGVANLALVAINGTVNITCHGNFPIVFTEIYNLTLEDLTFYSCPVFNLSELLYLNLLSCHMEVSLLQDSWQLTATNVFGISKIAGLIVTFPILPYPPPSLQVVYDDNYNQTLPADNKLKVDNCTFLPKQFVLQTIEFIVDLSQTTYGTRIFLNQLVVNPVANTRIIAHIWSSTQNIINISKLNLTQANLQVRNLAEESKASLSVSNCYFDTSLFSFQATSMSFTIEDSIFHRSPGVIYAHYGAVTTSYSSVTLTNVTFADSEGFPTPFIDFYSEFEGTLMLWGIPNAVLVDCHFIGNRPNNDQVETKGSSLALSYSYNVNLTNCKFRDNLKRAIIAGSSALLLSGENVFSNNTASTGGAMAFYGVSYVTFANRSTTRFINNSATMVGGAIHVANVHTPMCVFWLQTCNKTSLPFSVSFEGNTATNGGDKLYGASLDICWVGPTWTNACIGSNYVEALFNVSLHQSESSHFSDITSDPIRACLCVNGRPSCTTVFSNLTVYPGETVQIPAIVVGDRFGSVDGTVYAQLLPTNDTKTIAKLENLQVSQQVTHKKCTEISYTILSNSSSVTLVLTANSEEIKKYPSTNMVAKVMNEVNLYDSTGMIKASLHSFPVYINITLLPCPLGFELSGKPPRCNCDAYLLKHHINCNLSTQTVQRSGTQWVNASFKHHEYHGVIVDNYCPNNYCKPEIVNVDLGHPDSQCAFNRSGILCGGCPVELSLALGSSQCLLCSKAYLALLIPFALAGFALVFFIKILNLTVAEGTLNGLIFYANIVRANQVAWMPGHDTNILTVFIAWLNLDLGIKTCFIDGLNAYWRTWLQFIFPLYIWAIATAIVVLSHYFSAAARFFGSNSVQVLATLLFLSYSKLLRLTISILQASTMNYPGGQSSTLWSHDGNIAYLGPKHVPLFLVALAVIVFLWLPYTCILTTTQFLQRVPNYRTTKVLVKLKPVLDAYYGPFKDKHRYWVGLLLLLRGVLFISFSIAPLSNSSIDLLITFSVALALLTYLTYVGLVYKKAYLSLLENSFILNLGILAGGTLYVNTTGGNQAALAYTSVGIAFVQCVIIVAAHTTASFKAFFTRCRRPILQASDQAEYEGITDSPAKNAQSFQELVISFNDFREPVLKYSDSET